MCPVVCHDLLCVNQYDIDSFKKFLGAKTEPEVFAC